MLKDSDSSIQIHAVLFDFGGVIAEEGFREGLQALAEKQQLDPENFSNQGRIAVHDSGYVTGAGSESDFWALLRQRTGLSGTDAELTQDILSRFIIRPWMLEQVQRLRAAGIITVILSDQTDWLDRLERQFLFSKHFDQVFNSYHTGKTKQDASLFDDVIKQLGIQPEQALFIDDDAGHVQRARERGLNAIQFENREQFETQFQALIGKQIK